MNSRNQTGDSAAGMCPKALPAPTQPVENSANQFRDMRRVRNLCHRIGRYAHSGTKRVQSEPLRSDPQIPPSFCATGSAMGIIPTGIKPHERAGAGPPTSTLHLDRACPPLCQYKYMLVVVFAHRGFTRSRKRPSCGHDMIGKGGIRRTGRVKLDFCIIHTAFRRHAFEMRMNNAVRKR